MSPMTKPHAQGFTGWSVTNEVSLPAYNPSDLSFGVCLGVWFAWLLHV